MTSLTDTINRIVPAFYGALPADIRWAQRWAQAHKVRKAGRDYRFTDKQVQQMAENYAARS